MPATRDPLVARLRDAWRVALARYEADRTAGRETDSVRTVAERFLVLLNEKPPSGLDVVSDVELRATVAAAIMAEVEAMERNER